MRLEAGICTEGEDERLGRVEKMKSYMRQCRISQTYDVGWEGRGRNECCPDQVVAPSLSWATGGRAPAVPLRSHHVIVIALRP